MRSSTVTTQYEARLSTNGPSTSVTWTRRSTTRIAGTDAYTQARVLSLPHERHLKLVPEVQSANDDADSDQHHDGSESDRGAGDGRPEGHGGYTPPRAYRGYMIARGMAIVPSRRSHCFLSPSKNRLSV